MPWGLVGDCLPHPLAGCVPHLCIFTKRAIAEVRLMSELAMKVASEQRQKYPEPNLQYVHLWRHLRERVAFEGMPFLWKLLG